VNVVAVADGDGDHPKRTSPTTGTRAVAAAVEAQCPGIAVLATSRQPLDLPDLVTESIGNIAREGQPVLPIDQTWLSLMLKERPTGITGSCNYKRELLDDRLVAEWMADLVALLGAAVAQPNTQLGRLIARRAA